MANSTNFKKLLSKEMSRKDFLSFIFVLFISSFGIYEVIHKLLSDATGPYATADPATGTLTTGASATGGSTVQFGTTSSASPLPTAPSSIAGITVPTTIVFDDEFEATTLDTTKWLPGWYKDNLNGGGAFGSTNTLVESNIALGANGLELTLSGSPSAGIVGCISSAPWSNQGPWTPNATLGITNPIDDFTGFSISPAGGGVGGTNPGASGPVYIEIEATDPSGGGGMANWLALWTYANADTAPANSNLEIDLLETGGVANSTVHYIGYPSDPTDPAYYQRVSVPAGTPPATGGVPHKWGVLWTTSFVAFVHDGVAQTPFYFSAAGVGTLSQPPQAIVLVNTYGGLAPVFPATATVRYARVWQD